MQHDLIEVRERMRVNGIPTLLQGGVWPYHKATLYLLVDSQYEEACRLLDDPDYEVESAVSPETLIELETHAASSNVLWRSIRPLAIGAVFFLFLATVFLIGLVS